MLHQCNTGQSSNNKYLEHCPLNCTLMGFKTITICEWNKLFTEVRFFYTIYLSLSSIKTTFSVDAKADACFWQKFKLLYCWESPLSWSSGHLNMCNQIDLFSFSHRELRKYGESCWWLIDLWVWIRYFVMLHLSGSYECSSNQRTRTRSASVIAEIW